MRERLFAVIHKLEKLGWRDDSDLVKVLRKIAESDDKGAIEDLLEVFKA